MIRGLENVLASRKAFIDATASRDAVAVGGGAGVGGAAAPRPPPAQQLVPRQPHGFVGLFNQGATCYLNSFLQALFMLPDFRAAVLRFQLPPGSRADSSVAAQLQALFIRLLAGANGATSTQRVTQSFGWGIEEVFMQQDVQELFQKVFEALQHSVAPVEAKQAVAAVAAGAGSDSNDGAAEAAALAAAAANAANAELASVLRGFSGMQRSYVECQNCHTRTTRPDPFLNLCLPVQRPGAPAAADSDDPAAAAAAAAESASLTSLERALRAASQPEVLSGSNAYRCSSALCNGTKQTAHKGAEFTAFPDTFSVQLLRFDMDWNTMQRVKNTSTFSFPPRINLHDYLAKDVASGASEGACAAAQAGEARNVDRGQCEYALSAVLIHAGAASAGHYYAYIQDSVSGNFLKFNDAHVDWVADEERRAIFADPAGVGAGAAGRAAAEVAAACAAAAEHASKLDGEIAASAGDAYSSDEDEAAAAERRLRAARQAAPFVDPKRHAYILMYRRVAPVTADAAGAADTSTASAPARTTVAPLSDAEFAAVVAQRCPELAEENAVFERRLAEQKAAANRITIEVHYDPLASCSSAAAEAEAEAAAKAKVDVATEAKAHAEASANVPASAVAAAAAAAVDGLDGASVPQAPPSAPPSAPSAPSAPGIDGSSSGSSGGGPSFHTLSVTKLEVERSVTLSELHSIAHAALLGTGIPPGDARLRPWDGLRHAGEKPFLPGELGRSLRSLGWRGRKALLLEVRQAGGAFPRYRPRQTGLQLVELDAARDAYKGARHFEVDHDAVLAEVRATVASMLTPPEAESQAEAGADATSLGVSPARVKLVLSSHGLAVELVEEHKSLAALRIVRGDTIYAEVVPLTLAKDSAAASSSSASSSGPGSGSGSAPGAGAVEEVSWDDPRATSRILAKFDSLAHTEPLQFNNPFLVPGARLAPEAMREWSEAAAVAAGQAPPPAASLVPEWANKRLEIDVRSSLGTLKSLLSTALSHLPPRLFRLRAGHAGPELKDLTKGISTLGLNGLIYVELGAPLSAGQYIVRVAEWAPQRAERALREEKEQREAEEAEAEAKAAEATAGEAGPPDAPPCAPPMAPPCAPPMAPPCAPPMAPPCAPPMAPPCAPPMAPPCAPPMAPPCAPALTPSPGPAGPAATSSPAPSFSAPALLFSPSDPFLYLGELVVQSEWDLAQVKAAIVTAFPGVETPLEPELMRVREKVANKLTRCFRVDKNLRENCGGAASLRDYKVLVVQWVGSPQEAALTSAEVVLSLAQWDPARAQLGAPREVVLPADMPLRELQAWISAREAGERAEARAAKAARATKAAAASGDAASSVSDADAGSADDGPIPPESIGFEKPLPYQLTDPAQLSALKFNVDWVTAESTLSNSQVVRVRDGDLLVWVDRRAHSVAQYNEYRESDDVVHSEKVGERERHRELRIYSPQEQAEMAAAIAQVAEFEKAQARLQAQQAQAQAPPPTADA